MPLTMRSAFYPLIGNIIYGPVGDIIDAVSIACTTFGVCTSLGLGVDQIVAYYAALQDKSYTALERIDAQTATIIVMTLVANISVVLGLHKGIQVLSTITFSLGLFVLIATLFLDNTWFLLNSVVQSTGHYLQYVVQIGFRTDSFEQLGIEFGTNNLLWGSNKASKPDGVWSGPILDIMNNAAAQRTDYNSSHDAFRLQLHVPIRSCPDDGLVDHLLLGLVGLLGPLRRHVHRAHLPRSHHPPDCGRSSRGPHPLLLPLARCLGFPRHQDAARRGACPWRWYTQHRRQQRLRGLGLR